ncbi:helix-turn-helix transcriptional regulator [Serratia odorifera]|uniref:helix-turn-helix transcriptional regulator n=1 Tax=Serratia odorifera TaxID=618 RepID=UPI003531EF65
MYIFSSDEFLTLGLVELQRYLPLAKKDNIWIIDSGKDNLYVFMSTSIVNITCHDPFTALNNSRYKAFPRNATLDQLYYFLSSVAKESVYWPKKHALTEMEERIIRGIHHGISLIDIGNQQGISNKRISFHRKNILRKLDIDNMSVLVTLLHVWAEFWRVFQTLESNKSGKINTKKTDGLTRIPLMKQFH